MLLSRYRFYSLPLIIHREFRQTFLCGTHFSEFEKENRKHEPIRSSIIGRSNQSGKSLENCAPCNLLYMQVVQVRVHLVKFYKFFQVPHPTYILVFCSFTEYFPRIFFFSNLWSRYSFVYVYSKDAKNWPHFYEFCREFYLVAKWAQLLGSTQWALSLRMYKFVFHIN